MVKYGKCWKIMPDKRFIEWKIEISIFDHLFLIIFFKMETSFHNFLRKLNFDFFMFNDWKVLKLVSLFENFHYYFMHIFHFQRNSWEFSCKFQSIKYFLVENIHNEKQNPIKNHRKEDRKYIYLKIIGLHAKNLKIS